jgi:hypothetical protein
MRSAGVLWCLGWIANLCQVASAEPKDGGRRSTRAAAPSRHPSPSVPIDLLVLLHLRGRMSLRPGTQPPSLASTPGV